MFFDDTISRLRGLLADSLTDTCMIYRETTSQGSMGEVARVRELVAGNVPCRIVTAGRDNNSGAQTAGERETIEERYRLVVGHDVDLQSDCVVITGNAEYIVVRVERSLSQDVMTQAIITRQG